MVNVGIMMAVVICYGFNRSDRWLILKGAKYDRRMCMLTLYVCLWLMDVNDGQSM